MQFPFPSSATIWKCLIWSAYGSVLQTPGSQTPASGAAIGHGRSGWARDHVRPPFRHDLDYVEHAGSFQLATAEFVTEWQTPAGLVRLPHLTPARCDSAI